MPLNLRGAQVKDICMYTQKLLALGVLALTLVSLAACGPKAEIAADELKSTRNPQVTDPGQGLEVFCNSKGGSIINNLCVYVKQSKKLKAGSSEGFVSHSLGQAQKGMAVSMSGKGSVQLLLGGVSLGEAPVAWQTLKSSGLLTLQVLPGTYEDTAAYLVACTRADDSLAECPFKAPEPKK